MQENIPTSDNNPGDLKDPSTGGFQKFSTPIEGQAALYNQLELYANGKTRTGLNANSSLVDFAKVYAPASDNNQPLQYAANIANKMGVHPDTPIGQLIPRIDDWGRAIADNEGYEGPWAGKAGAEQNPIAPPGNQSSMPDWKTYGLAGLVGVLGGVGALFTGGADIPETIGTEGAILGAGEAAAGTGVAEAAPGLLSRLFGGAKSLATKAATGYGADKLIQGITGGGGQPSLPATPPPNPSDLSSAAQAVYQGQEKALSATQTGRVMAASPEGQVGMAANALYGLAPEVEKTATGSLAFNSAPAIEKSKDLVSDMHNNMAAVLDAEGQTGSLDEVASTAIDNMRKTTPMHEQADAEDYINKEIGNYHRFAEGGNMKLGDMMRGKAEMGKAAGDWNKYPVSAQRSAMKSLSMGFRGTIEKHTANKDLFNKAMAEEQKLINGRKVLEKLHGKVAHRRHGLVHLAVSKLADYAAIAIGDKIGGPFGAIVGSVIGETLTKAVDKRIGRALLDTPSIKKAIDQLSKGSPKLARVLKQKIQQYAEQHAKEMQEAIKREEFEKKRQEYRARKKSILEGAPAKPSEYEHYTPHDLLPVIKGGRKLKSREAKLFANLPVIR